MRILFLDDMLDRHQAFRRNRIGHDITHVETAPEAIAVLKRSEPFDIVQLDHDLAEEHYLKASEGLSEERREGEAEYLCGTGMDVVDFICTMPKEKRPKLVIIHSWNLRWKEMYYRLYDAGVPVKYLRFDPHN